MKQVFEIPGRLAGCNDYQEACRRHHHVGARMKRAQQDIVLLAIKAAKLKPMHGLVNIHYTWVEPNMRRDKGNIRFADKFIEDALVEAGILAGDGWKHVGDLSDTYLVNKNNPRIIVELEEA